MGLYPAVGDLDGDGLPELLIGSNTGGIRLLKNTSEKVVPPTESLEFVAYPNPTSQFLYVQTPVLGQLELYSMTGQLIQKQVVIQTAIDTAFDTSLLPTGIYFIRLTTADTQTTRKVVVAH